MATLLLELFSEEIPSRMQRGAAEQLERLILAGLEKNLLTHDISQTYVSPRHLAIKLSGLPTIQPDTREERKGPKIGAPEQAMNGFLTAAGVKITECEQRDGYYYAIIERKGRPAVEVLKTVIEDALAAFSWPKSMRWGARSMQWVRPLHRIIALLDGTVIPAQFGHLTASNVTEGHRFLAPKPITITHSDHYEGELHNASVMLDAKKRRHRIVEQIDALAKEHGLTRIADSALEEEVTGLVEWPVPLMGEFEAKFLELPPEVLISEMKTHQRYFALTDSSGKLTNRFITVANMVTNDNGKQVMDGNSRVVRARLSDGEFYWQQDQKTRLEDWGQKLADVVFHAKVGMMDAKVARIEALAAAIAKEVGFRDSAAVTRAARLCKADLTSGMVGEFPELQGIMGRYYATAQGETPEVADAIRDHYKPLGAGDSLPESDLAAIIALADKLDSIISLFTAGEKPTGSKDPLALRRAALGVLRIMFNKQWGFDLNALIQSTVDMSSHEVSHAIADVILFLVDRIKVVLRDEGVRHDVIEAAITLPGGTNLTKDYSFNPLTIAQGANALTSWLVTTNGKDALAAIKRVLNILAAEEKKAKARFAYDKAALGALIEPAEKQLLAALEKAENSLAGLETLAAPINQFFTDILINADDAALRAARIALLAGIRAHALGVANFAGIDG